MKCSICKTEVDDMHITMLEDKSSCCTTCYHKVFDELFKGQFTSSKALEVMAFLRDYELFKDAYVLLMRRYLKSIDITNTSSVQNFIYDQEESVSLELLSKHRQHLSKQEHIFVICNVMEYIETLQDINKYPDLGIELNPHSLRNSYVAECEYLC